MSVVDELDFDRVMAIDVQTIYPFDTARTRRSDPVTSHVAADRSAKSLSDVKVNVLRLFEIHGELTGSEINDFYRAVPSWSRVHFDTPRKRVGELAADGVLVEVGVRDGERVFRRG